MKLPVAPLSKRALTEWSSLVSVVSELIYWQLGHTYHQLLYAKFSSSRGQDSLVRTTSFNANKSLISSSHCSKVSWRMSMQWGQSQTR